MIAAVELDQGPALVRPRTRGDCARGLRPCPWASCLYHLWPTVAAVALREGRTPPEPDELEETCALDVADRGGATLEEVGDVCHVTRERIRQIEARALPRLYRACLRADLSLEDLISEHHVGGLAGLLGGRSRPGHEESPAGYAWKPRRRVEVAVDQAEDCDDDADQVAGATAPDEKLGAAPDVDDCDADADEVVHREKSIPEVSPRETVAGDAEGTAPGCLICGGPIPPRLHGGRRRVVCAKASCHAERQRQYNREWAREHPSRRHRAATPTPEPEPITLVELLRTRGRGWWTAEDVAAATGWTVDEARAELAGDGEVERDGTWWRAP